MVASPTSNRVCCVKVGTQMGEEGVSTNFNNPTFDIHEMAHDTELGFFADHTPQRKIHELIDTIEVVATDKKFNDS